MSRFELLIPQSWSAEEALAAVGLLNELERAVWRVHGAAMTDAFARNPLRWGDALYPVDENPEDEDDIPF